LWKRFKAQIRRGDFDIVHRLTPLTPTTPSLLARKCRRAGVPFILGPLNGGLPWPKGFDGVRRAEKEWLSYVRSAYKLLPGYRSTREAAAAIIVGSEETLRQMPERYHDKCVYIPENAVDPARFAVVRTRRAVRPIKLVFVGRLVPYKGADMLLEAAAPLMRAGDVRVEIVGGGPQEAELRGMVEKCEIGEFTTLCGELPHQQVQSKLVDADLLCFPSIREFGGGVVLEAMAVGLAPMVVRYGGPAELATEETGFFIGLGSRQEIVAQLREKLSELVQHPEQIDSKSEPARQRVLNEFTWDAKAKKVLGVYQKVLADRIHNEKR
jgi:glycosyltransferase involved in cell wall biosynthesis